MQITVVAVGKRMPGWITQGIHEYIKRFPPGIDLKVVSISPVKRKKSISHKKAHSGEVERIKAAIPKHSYIIALDEKGKQHNSQKLSDRLSDWIQDGQDVVFIIGGADGIAPSIISDAHEVWSLSKYTMPHAIARVFLIEQLYRAWSILNNHPYHRK